MGIWEWVALKSEAVKRDAPDATPVKNSCRNSYNLSSAAFAKIDQTIRTIALRRVAKRTPADEIPAKEEETDRGVLDANSMKNGKIDQAVRTVALRRFAQRTPADEIPAKEAETDRGVLDANSMKNGKIDQTVRTIALRRFAQRTPADEIPAKEEETDRGVLDANSMKNGKIDQAVRTIALCRFAQRSPADEIPAKEAETGRGVLDANSMKNGGTSSCAYGYGFITFAKIGYTFRVKGVYRIVHWMKNDGTKSITSIYDTNFTQNAELHASKEGDELFPGQVFVMPMEKECMNSYTFGFITFARIGYVVRVNVYRFGQWMADDDTKARMALYSTIFAKNICRYALQDFNKLMIPGGVGVAIFIILSNTLIDIIHEHQKLSKEKAGSPQEPFSGDLKDEAIFSGIKELLIFVVNEFIAFMMEEPFRTQFFGRGVFTMDSLVFIMRKLLVFTMKRHFGTQFLSETDDIVVAVMTALFGAGFVNDFEFHGSTTKKGRKKKGKRFSS